MSRLPSVNLAPIETKLAPSAFNLFRCWTARVNSSDNIVIKDEQVLVDDLRDTFHDAVRSLAEKDMTDKPVGWDVGFVLGFVGGSLGVKWHHDYVVRNSDEYKAFAALKAIESYLTFDELTRVRIDKLYDHVANENSNLDHINLNIMEKDISLETLEEVTTSSQGRVMTTLKNMIVRQISIVAKMKNTHDLPIRDFFAYHEIKHLIDINERQIS